MRTIQEIAAQTTTCYTVFATTTTGGDNTTTIIDAEDSIRWVTPEGTLTASNELDRATSGQVGYVYLWEPADENRQDVMDGEESEEGILAVIDTYAG